MDAAKVKAIHRNRWSQAAGEYEAVIVPLFRPVVDAVLAGANLRPGLRVLDAGCGPGAAALRAATLVQPGGTVTGIDIAPDMIERATAAARLQQLTNVTFLVGDAEDLQFAAGSFDVVIASLSLMLCPDPERALREIRRVLTPAGRFSFAVWGSVERTAMGRLRQLAEVHAAPPPGMTDANTLGDPDLVARLCAAAGLAATVEARTVELEYRDVEHFWEAHNGSIKARLEAGQIEAIHRQIVTEFGPAAPLRLANECIVATGGPARS